MTRIEGNEKSILRERGEYGNENTWSERNEREEKHTYNQVVDC